MNLSQLHYFKVVAEHGKINSAADDLFISSPALSASIASLERELGVKLFDRMSNRITLNKQGQLFLRCTERIFDDLDSTKLEIQRSLQQQDKILHIAVTNSEIWVPLISAFVEKYPNITLSWSTVKIQQLRKTLSSPNYSFILAEKEDLLNTNMERICLFDERPMVVLPAEHPLAGCKAVHLNELADQTFFLPMVDHSLNNRIKKMLLDNNIIFKHIYECSETIANSMVLEGRGMSFCTDHYIHPRVDGLRAVPIATPNCHWTQCLFWNSAFLLSAEEEIFKNQVLELYTADE